jgi:hypothetical protein
LLRYLVFGNVVGGYGAEVHLNFSVSEMIFTLTAYFAKFFLLYRYIPDEIIWLLKTDIVRSSVIVMIIGFAILLFVLRKSNRYNHSIRLILFSVAAIAISLAPVINLETSFLENIQSDRYGFLPSIFFVLTLVFLLGLARSKAITTSIILLTIAVFSFSLWQTNNIWEQAHKLRTSFAESATDILKRDSKALIVNIPDNYKGVYLFREGLSEMMLLNYGINLCETNYIFNQNMDKLEKTNVAFSEKNGIILSQNSSNYPIRINSLYKDDLKISYRDFTIFIEIKKQSNFNYYYTDISGSKKNALILRRIP